MFSKIGLVDPVKTVHTKLFAKIAKLHKFATINSNFKKSNYFRHASSYNVHVSIISKIGLEDLSKPYTQIYSQNIVSCINLQLLIEILKKPIISDMHHRIT